MLRNGECKVGGEALLAGSDLDSVGSARLRTVGASSDDTVRLDHTIAFKIGLELDGARETNSITEEGHGYK